MRLIDLSILGAQLKSHYEQNFKDDDIRLPQSFKDLVKQFDSAPIDYKSFNFIVESTSGLRIFYPNQTIYIAAYFTDYFLELEKYKEIIVSVGKLNADEIKACRNNKERAERLLSSNRFVSVDEEDKELLVKFLCDYSWWNGGKTIDRTDYYVSPILSLANLVNASHGFVADICRNLALNPAALHSINEVINGNLDSYYLNPQFSSNIRTEQIIYFGAPGTGKSFKVEHRKGETEDDRIRTTFHPDSDYSSFVGCYKPMQDESNPQKIIYKFEGQCFTKAYIEAWKRYVACKDGQSINFTLVIEEINRGNCAQIFGDIFQLLDRDQNGFSQYSIQPDEDLAKHLCEQFESLKDKFESKYAKIAKGEEMKLPPNLSIIATMNTSDQSLFPIDSAFKRRWDWEYIPIQYSPIDEETNKPIANKIDINGTIYDWGEFIKEVNKRIYKLTKSEDKELGYFFVRPDDGENITMQRFVSKVIFYLWSDIYKDYSGRGDSIFKMDNDKDPYSFNSFFEEKEIKVDLVKKFIEQFIESDQAKAAKNQPNDNEP